jgi:hypothetical protein
MLAHAALTIRHSTRQMVQKKSITSEATILEVGFMPLSRQAGVCEQSQISTISIKNDRSCAVKELQLNVTLKQAAMTVIYAIRTFLA